jgi:hypothetical protein
MSIISDHFSSGIPVYNVVWQSLIQSEMPASKNSAVRRLALVDLAESSSAPNPEPSTRPSVDDSRHDQPLDVDALASPVAPLKDQYVSDSILVVFLSATNSKREVHTISTSASTGAT